MKTPVRLRAWHSNTIEDADGRTVCIADTDAVGTLIVRALNGPAAPIDMVLRCPNCGEQHIDAPEAAAKECVLDAWPTTDGLMKPWSNPPHRSHLCHGCGFIWRPADVATNGVAAVRTKGKADSVQGPAKCSWVQEDEDSDAWSTGCNNIFRLDDGTPSANRMAFCCFCGKKVEEAPYVPEEEVEP